MAEVTLDLRGKPKAEAYAELKRHTEAVLEGIDDDICAMATMSCLLHHAFGHLWTGFYRVVTPGKLLRVGPYQGTLGCLEITFGKGVCGTSASEARTLVVEDVHAFPGHITCDGRSASEIVVPVFGKNRELLAVLDIDSEHKAAFDEVDRQHLEELMAWFSRAKR
jgi:L-methionine (R)-S-oxide reductase